MTEQGDAAETVAIARLGHRGDGIAEAGYFVPFALPGERVRVEVRGERARLIEVVEPSGDRIAPICPHFGRCGGCAVQHLDEEAYRVWKRSLVETALRQRRLEAEVEPLIPCPPRSRRRAVLAGRRNGPDAALGFHERLSHRLVPVDVCPVVEPRIEQALPGLAGILAGLKPRKAEAIITVLATEAGLDVAIDAIEPLKYPKARAELVSQAGALGLARLSLSGEIAATFAEPRLTFGQASVVPPPGAFVQAVASAEAEMARLVTEGVGSAKRVADLFAGVGTFGLRLASQAGVHAVEADSAAAQALGRAVRAAQGLKQMTVEIRDLFRRPLAGDELNRFDAVVFDPPRAGAEAQAAKLAESKVGSVVAVSCNPGSFARDARTLVDGGYKLLRVIPIDQFAFSSHVEIVAHFAR